MGRISNQVRQNDIAGWGAAALVCGAVAVFSANVAGLVPESVLGGLHATRIQGGSFNQMRAQMAEMRTESSRISRDYRTLLTRFNLLDDDSGELVRRLTALETSVPLLIESLPAGTDIDYSLLTASIGGQEAELAETDGGAIAIRQSPLFGEDRLPGDQPLPPSLDETAAVPDMPESASGTIAQGIMLGAPGDRDAALANWSEAVDRAGPLLLGTVPVLAEQEDGQRMAIAGPLPDLAAAETLCDRLDRVGIDCAPAPYQGASWPE